MDSDLVSIGVVAAALGVSVSQVRKLTNEGRISAVTTSGGHRRYDLSDVRRRFPSKRFGPFAPMSPSFRRSYPIRALREDEVWRELSEGLEMDVQLRRLWSYTVTEMVNNAIDHSGGSEVLVTGYRTEQTTRVVIEDDGVGVFDRLRTQFHLPDGFAAIQELSKGKATTAPDRHTGEGIFFTSKLVDRFRLSANGLAWLVANDVPDMSVAESPRVTGTGVDLELANTTTRSIRDVFDEFTIDGAFVRTRPAVRLLEYGTEFVSRSEAKRLAERLEQFVEVEVDFSGVEFVGQGFVDELFRVWAKDHPGTKLIPVQMNDEVSFMIQRGLGPSAS